MALEASLRRIAHYDYWSDKVRRSILLDAKADLLLYGNAERALVEVAHRTAAGEHPKTMHDLRGTAFIQSGDWPEGWAELDSTELDQPGPTAPHPQSFPRASPGGNVELEAKAVTVRRHSRSYDAPKRSFAYRHDQLKNDPVLCTHASRLLHLETNPGNAAP